MELLFEQELKLRIFQHKTTMLMTDLANQYIASQTQGEVNIPTFMTQEQAVQIASALGGLTIRNKSTGLPHLLSFSWFGRIEHGIAVARLLPAAWRYYIGRKAVETRTLEIGRTLGGSTAEEVIQNYEKLLDMWQVPRLSDYPELTAERFEQTCRSAGANRMKLELAPRPVPLESSEEILRNVLVNAMKN